MSYESARLTFRVSGLCLLFSITLLSLGISNAFAKFLWVLGGISVPVCLYAAWKMKCGERAVATADANMLKDAHTPRVSESSLGGADDD
jgi:uncharacterized membrane protein